MRGSRVERETPTETADPATPGSPDPTEATPAAGPTGDATPSPTVSPRALPRRPAPRTTAPPASPTTEPQPTASPAPSPTEEPSPSPSAAPPREEQLQPGRGWSYDAQWADESGWQAVSGQPPSGPDGTTRERLFVRLLHEEGVDGGRWFSCTGWLAAAPDAYLNAAGQIWVRLLHGDRQVSSTGIALNQRVDPGGRYSGLDLADFVHVPPDGQVVTCSISFDS